MNYKLPSIEIILTALLLSVIVTEAYAIDSIWIPDRCYTTSFASSSGQTHHPSVFANISALHIPGQAHQHKQGDNQCYVNGGTCSYANALGSMSQYGESALTRSGASYGQTGFGGLEYRYRHRIGNYMFFFACRQGENWNSQDTDGDGSTNIEEINSGTQWWNDTDTPETEDNPCDGIPDQLVSELGKEWDLLPSGLPDKYNNDIGGTICSFDRVSVGVDSTNVTATYSSSGAEGGFDDKPVDFSQYVLRRCDGEVLTGDSIGIAWDALPSSICSSSDYGVCVFETPIQGGSTGSLTVDYTGVDSLSCDASSQITPVWDEYAELCTERPNIVINEQGDLWSSQIPQTIGDGTCQYVRLNAFCQDGNCIANYEPDGNYTTDIQPDFSQYAETLPEEEEPVVSPNPGFDLAGDSALQLPINSTFPLPGQSITGRTDVCSIITNCSGEGCPVEYNNGEVDTIDNHMQRILALKNANNESVQFHYQGNVRIFNSQEQSYELHEACQTYQAGGNYAPSYLYRKLNGEFTTAGVTDLGDGHQDYRIGFHQPNSTRKSSIIENGQQVICSITEVVPDYQEIKGSNRLDVYFDGQGFSEDGSCESTTEPDTGEGTTDSSSTDAILTDILEALNDPLDNTETDGQIEEIEGELNSIVADMDALLETTPDDHETFFITDFESIKDSAIGWLPSQQGCATYSMPVFNTGLTADFTCDSTAHLRQLLEYILYVGVAVFLFDLFTNSNKGV